MKNIWHRWTGCVLALLVCTLLVHCGRGGTTVPVQRGPIVEAVYGIGTVTARHSFQLKLANPATVERVFVREGDQVATGTLLLRLTDGRQFTSPLNGTVTALPFQDHENVFAQTLLVQVVDLTDRYLLVSLEQIGALHVAAGQNVRASFEALRNEKISGVVRTIYPSDGQFLVDITPSALPANIVPGMTADVAIEIAHVTDALLVPRRAVHDGVIRVQRDGQRLTILVTTGATDGTSAQILTGDVREGDAVIVE